MLTAKDVLIQYNSTGEKEKTKNKRRPFSLPQEKEEALNSKTMSANLLDKKLKGLEGENRRLLDALKAFGRRSLNNAVNTNHLVGTGGVGGGMTSGGVIGGVSGVFGAATSTTTPLGISRPFRTVTPLHRATPELNQLTVQVNEGTS